MALPLSHIFAPPRHVKVNCTLRSVAEVISVAR